MKNLFSLVCLVVLLGVSVNVMGQGEFSTPQKTLVNSTRTYSVTEVTTNTYLWQILSWTSTEDFGSQTWAEAGATAANFTLTNADEATANVVWNVAGHYVVQVTETQNGCTTKRRFGVHVLDLDLLVNTFYYNQEGSTPTLNNDVISADVLRCNTNEGNKWTNTDPVNLNTATDPELVTMKYIYDVKLYTVKGSTTTTDLIGDASQLPLALWKFTPVATANQSIPSSPGEIEWTIKIGAAAETSYTFGNEVFVPAGTSVVTISAVIQNIAAAEAAQYVIDWNIDPATVMVENSATPNTDYAEGTEDAANENGAGVNKNNPYKVTVKPIPNTSRITTN